MVDVFVVNVNARIKIANQNFHQIYQPFIKKTLEIAKEWKK